MTLYRSDFYFTVEMRFNTYGVPSYAVTLKQTYPSLPTGVDKVIAQERFVAIHELAYTREYMWSKFCRKNVVNE